MAELTLGIGLFVLAFIVHVIVWRVSRFAHTARNIIFLFVFSIVFGLVLVWGLSQVCPAVSEVLPQTLGEWSHATILALAIAASYVMAYPAIEVDSPTFLIAESIKDSGIRGISRADLIQRFGNEFLVGSRIDDLVNEGLANYQQGRYYLNTQGSHFADMFLAWRRLLRANKGG